MNAHLATVSSGELRDGVLAVTGERISWVGSRKEWRDKARVEHDARGAWITPALIDCHTHLVYAGNRAHEFELRLKGATYEEIARAGGGILSTVKATRAASEDDLVQAAQKRLQNTIQGLERERDKSIKSAETDYARESRAMQNRVKFNAVIWPPILPLLMGVAVFFNRRAREREGVAKSRLR